MATSLNKLNTEKLKEFLKCSLCQNTFDENEHSPRLLDCLHSFCLNCLEKKLSNNSFCCPNCNESNDFRGRAITDLQADKRWEVYQKFVEVFSERDQILCGNCKRNNESVVIFCQQCSFFLCGECDKAHKIWSDFQNHTVFAIENLKGDWSVLKNIAHAGISKCQVPNHLHQEQKFYCTNQNCSKPICAECCLAEHQTHAFISLQEHINMVQSKLAEQLEILQKNVKQYQENRKICHEEEDRLSNLESRLYKEIDDSFNICIKLMQGRREFIKANLRESVELKKTDFQKGIDECEQFQNSCMHLKEFLNTFKMLGDPSFLIEIFPVIIKRIRSLNEKTLTSKPDNFSHFEYDVDTFTTSVKAFVKTLGNVKDLSVSSEHSFIELPEKAVVHKTIEIFIHLKDGTGTPFSSQINGISLYINSSEEKGVKFTATWSDAKYSLKWKPDIQGKYTCRVLVQNHDVNVAAEIFICENTDQVAQLKPQKETDNVKDTKSKAIQVKEAEPSIVECRPKAALTENSSGQKSIKQTNQVQVTKQQTDFIKLERESHIVDTGLNVAKENQQGKYMQLKSLPNIRGQHKVNDWEAFSPKKCLPPLEWLNLSSGPTKVSNITVRCNRPFSAIGLRPPPRVPEDRLVPPLRRSRTDVFLESFEHKHSIELPVVRGGVVNFRPPIYFDVTTLHRDRCLSKDHRILSNKEMWETKRQLLAGKHLKNYTGSLLTLKLNKAIFAYFQFHVEYRIFRDMKASNLIVEVAINNLREIDMSESTFFRNSGWSLQICRCIDCYKVCLFAHCNSTFVHEPVSSDRAGTSQICSYGLCINALKRTIQLVDVNQNRLLGTFSDVNITEEDVVAIGVYNPSRLDVTVSLESGSEIRKMPFGILDPGRNPNML